MQKKNSAIHLAIKSNAFKKCTIGDSIAIDGVCLTVTDHKDTTATFDVVEETLKCTTLKFLHAKDQVHVEKPLTALDALHGHMILGHVDCTAHIIAINEKKLTIAIPKELQKKIVHKGSIAINGVSLTVAHLDQKTCTVALIPETIKKTTLKNKKPGDQVNIEIDLPERYKTIMDFQKTQKIAIVAAEFNASITKKLVRGALHGLREHKIKNTPIFWVPGAFEIPLIAKKLAHSGKYHAIITLGCVIKGETAHYENVCRETAHGIAQAALETGIPIIFEVLMCDTTAKAHARARDDMHNNKGYHAATAAIKMVKMLQRLLHTFET